MVVAPALSALCYAPTAYAQTNDSALAQIKYEFVHVDDTNFRDDPRKEEMMVYIGEQSSMYKSHSLAVKLEEMKKEMRNRQAAMGPNNASFSFSSPNMSNETLYIFPYDKKLFIVDRIGMSNYILPQDFPVIDWQIEGETKDIGGYTCQKATGTFGGRRYTAWFTAELPFPYGPWKLHGLPGLILEAEDSKKEVMFHYAGFDKQQDEPIEIILPKEAVTTTSKAFEKAKEAFLKDPMGNMMRNMPTGANVQTKVVFKDQSGRELTPDEFKAMREISTKDGKARKLNNPLELNKK